MDKEKVVFSLPDATTVSAGICRSARARRITLRLSPTGHLKLTVPADVGPHEIEQCLPSFMPWIEKLWHAHEICHKKLTIPENIAVPLTGRSYNVLRNPALAAGRSLCPQADIALQVSLQSERLLIVAKENELRLFGHIHSVCTCAFGLRSFFRQLAGRLLPSFIRQLAWSAGCPAIDIAIRDQRSRWGSCARKTRDSRPKISLNWRAILLDVPLLEHLCWHELTHIKHMNHSKNFYGELARCSPDWRHLEKELGKHWRALPAWTFSAD